MPGRDPNGVTNRTPQTGGSMSTKQHDACSSPTRRGDRAVHDLRGPGCRRGQVRSGGQARIAAGGRGGGWGAHLGLREQRAARSAEGFEDGWFEAVRAVASDLLRIADHTAAQRGRAASSAQLFAHLRQPARARRQGRGGGCDRGPGCEGGFGGGAAVDVGLHRPGQLPLFRSVGRVPVGGSQRCAPGRARRILQRLEAFADRHCERLGGCCARTVRAALPPITSPALRTPRRTTRCST